jgi:hypothetical protein
LGVCHWLTPPMSNLGRRTGRVCVHEVASGATTLLTTSGSSRFCNHSPTISMGDVEMAGLLS